VLGHSYGAVAAIEGGARSSETAAVIADSGFVSVASMLDRSMAVLSGTSPWLAAALSLRALPGLDKVNALVFRLRSGVTLDLIELSVLPAVARLQDRPLLAIAGADDPLAVPENARLIFAASTAPGSELVILEGATHRTHELATTEYEAAVLRFLTSVGARP
jgi:pimeloyl-ACP methyl ester carboxylesterase